MPNKTINWGKVIYNEDEKKLIFFDQKIVRIPEAIINLFHDRVKHLDLSCNKIMSLDALQYFSEMEELILDNNLITEDVIFPPNSPNLRILSLNNNRIKNLNILLKKIRRSFPHLEYLSLLGNTACPYFFSNTDFDNYYEYRIHVIASLQHLRFLDTKEVTAVERKMTKWKTFKLLDAATSSSTPASLEYSSSNEIETDKNLTHSPGFLRFLPAHWIKKESKSYNPLPESKDRDPRVAYGKLQYKYVGNESEGNRFILNKDL